MVRGKFTGQAAVAMAAARAKVAAEIEAAGGREAWHARNAERQLRKDAQRRAVEAQAEVAKQEQLLDRARQAARAAADLADGMWALSLGAVGRDVLASYGGGFESARAAWAEAERSKAAGRGASVRRPYCGHWLQRLEHADEACQPCAAAKR